MITQRPSRTIALRRFHVAPTFIVKAAFFSWTLVPCPAPQDCLTPYVPRAEWPEHRERPDQPHLPHEERYPSVVVDSGASGGTYTNSSARSMGVDSSPQVAFLRNELSDKVIVIGSAFDEPFLESAPNPQMNLRPQTKPLAVASTRWSARALGKR